MEPAVAVSTDHRPGVVTVTMNRPGEHNALNDQLIEELTGAFHSLADQEDVRVIILTGNGRSFCAGADLKNTKAVAEAGFDRALAIGHAIFDLMCAVDSCPIPVIARVNGSAIGGGMGLVCSSDIAVTVGRAKFGFSEVRLGLMPAVISPFVLAKIGASKVRELFLTGERFDANQASEIGLVHWVVPEDQLDEKVAERAEQLLLGAPGAQSAVKLLLKEFISLPADEARSFTSDLFARRIVSDEGREGISAFLEKRKPDWID
ncbi:MAG: enoyl-CoA hydratase/isomerase family protein [Chloroflexota bacterium]|nr:MAG: enoyl-CoA hydratase/isomerase family protein [Chloroflexota bacterium]